MLTRSISAILLTVLVTGLMALWGLPGLAEPGEAPSSATAKPADTSTQIQDVTGSEKETTPERNVPGPVTTEQVLPPSVDPCLPPLYRDWRELGVDNRENGTGPRFAEIKIVIDRSLFLLTVQGINRDDTSEEIYRTQVGLGDPRSETPRGRYFINHVYCYPDVVFFDGISNPISEIYNGLFAPLLLCDGSGRCDRFRDLGIHGFHASAHPDPASIRPETEGPVSGGCIRVPDPCRFKLELVRLVGVGPLKKNERGSYHWLNKPVEVLITGDYPSSGDAITLLSILQGGLQHVQQGVKSFLGVFAR